MRNFLGRNAQELKNFLECSLSLKALSWLEGEVILFSTFPTSPHHLPRAVSFDVW